MISRTSKLENGLYLVEFSLFQEQYTLATESLKSDPNCHLLENIGKPYGMIMVFSIRQGITDFSRERYEDFREKVSVHRVYDILKDRPAGEFYLPGQINWIRARCNQEKKELAREMILSDPRISYTVWTEHNWLYSRHRVPEQSAMSEIRDRFLQVLGSENGLYFIPVITSLKDPGILDDELKKLL